MLLDSFELDIILFLQSQRIYTLLQSLLNRGEVDCVYVGCIGSEGLEGREQDSSNVHSEKTFHFGAEQIRKNNKNVISK